MTNMQVKGGSSDGIRVSTSSAHSVSSYGSVQDDADAFGEVYVWGEVVCDGFAIGGTDRNINPSCGRTDILLPKPLESNVVLDIHHISCGVRHATLVTRQGEVFTWGEESGGRLGHGVGTNAIHPRLVESLSASNVDFVACGEFHTCAVSVAGELYTWGDGTHNAGLLGHGTNVSHWIPKRVSGPLEGLQVAYVNCGTWHTALITSSGRLFTFGDGTFGVLGHGNRENVLYPREVESLMGLKTITVSCGVWHTAAVVEVIITQSSGSSGKLFTWGDGDKYRLGHGDKESRLEPTCVPSLIDYNFHKLACSHSLTVGLTTSGHVFTMGSTVYGQLGNTSSDGKLPCLVEDKIASESVKEVACGSYHVAVLTSRSEVYTWGKGANGRLGHGDFEDRKIPTLVEALKARSVKHIACGSNFTAAICHRKWVSGAEQSQCSACRQAFGFTRKRHNCYNCGLVHCHSCSSRKALRAALSPNPGRPYRVCDSCFVKLNQLLGSSGINERKNVITRLSGERKDRLDKVETKLTKVALPGNLDLVKSSDTKTVKYGRKFDYLSHSPPPLQLKDINLIGAIDLHGAFPKTIHVSAVQPVNHSRAVSPFSRKLSPPRSATPVPTISGLSFSRSPTDNLRKTNELLNQEVQKLRTEVEKLMQCSERQELEVQKSAKIAQEAMQIAAEEIARSKSAKEVIKSLTAQLKDMAERMPHGLYQATTITPMYPPNGIESMVIHHSDFRGENHPRNDASNTPCMTLSTTVNSYRINEISVLNHAQRDKHEVNKINLDTQILRVANSDGISEHSNAGIKGHREMSRYRNQSEHFDTREAEPLQNRENGLKPGNPGLDENQIEAEWIEQYEPGVYITLMALHDGARDLKRVRFSRRRFKEQQAEKWWSENREKVYEKYDVRGSDRISSSALSQSAC